MKYTKSDFLRAEEPTITVDEVLEDMDPALFAETPVESVPTCHVTGTLHFDGKSRVVSHIELDGILTVSDSITGEDVDVDFQTDSETEYSFEPLADSDEEEVVVVKQNTIDLMDEIIQAIAYEAPMSITCLKREDYPSGSGWSLSSDQDQIQNEKEEDPRWAKLKEFQIEDD